MDFDRTLFDTGAFVGALWRYLADMYHLDERKEQQRAREFYQYVGEQYDYYFFDHMASIKQLPIAEKLTHDIGEALGQKKFLFSDAYSIIPSIDGIVTFGNRPYQELKLSLCPELATIRQHITTEPKGEYVARIFADTPTVLVDDKLQQGLPSSCRFIRLDRHQVETVTNREEVVTIKSLEYLQQVLA